MIEAMEDVEWSNWMPLAKAAQQAPKLPGVYQARVTGTTDVVYVGMAGERSRNGKVPAKGLRARIKGYESGRVLTNGLGRAVVTNALRDPSFRSLVAATEIDDVVAFGKLAFEHAKIEIRWAETADKKSAVELENLLLAQLNNLWNRKSIPAKKIVKLEES